MSKKWTDLESNGRRIERMIRLMEKCMKECENEDVRIKYANAIAYATKTKMEIINRQLKLDTLVRMARRKYGVDLIDKEELR